MDAGRGDGRVEGVEKEDGTLGTGGVDGDYRRCVDKRQRSLPGIFTKSWGTFDILREASRKERMHPAAMDVNCGRAVVWCRKKTRSPATS